jgi:signal transduction histidine kinase
VARKRLHREASGYTILVVDDQEETLASVKLVLERDGHHVLVAEGGQRALELFGQNRVDLLLVDYFMPRMTGEELIAEIRKLDSQVQIVLQTGYAGEKPPRDMLHKLDIQGYHDKSDGPDRLLLWVDVALKAHRQLQAARDAERLKSHLLANLSHEFRTPLHVILGYTEILHEEQRAGSASGSGAEDVIGRIRNNAESLLRLVDDFLRLSDLDSGVAVPEAGEIPGEALREQCGRTAELLIRDKPIRYVWAAPADLPIVRADPAKVGIILINLLSNAVKFTASGTITVNCAPLDRTMAITVHDTGVGIDPCHHERIFETFDQVDGSSTRHHEGIGIGLAIARKLARLMGGDITVDSQPGQGAAFTLRLPCDAEAPSLAPALRA